MSMQLTPPALRRTNNVLDLTVDRTGTLFVASFTDLLTYTENNGASWQTTSLESSSVNASPTDDGLVYAMERTQMRGYLTRSADGGRSWQRYVWGLGSGAVAADPQDATAAYVAAGGCRQLAVTCVPRGTLWHVLGPERRETLRIAEFDERTSALATSTDGSRLWVATQDGKLLQSMDGGQSWWEVTGTPYSGFLIDLAPSPQDDRLLLAVTVDGQLWAYRQRPDPQDLVPLVAAPPLPWVVVFQPTPLYDIAGQVVANAEPGDRYRVLAVESDWALVGPEDGPPEATRWISLDGRVELTGD
jgi:ligand-binding sensor domain-containing protein